MVRSEMVIGSFSIPVKFKGSDGFEWWLTVVYGLNSPRFRFELWEDLSNLFGFCSPH